MSWDNIRWDLNLIELNKNTELKEAEKFCGVEGNYRVHFNVCGTLNRFVLLLTQDGVVFTFGSGQYGQLGHNSLRNELRPRLVAELWGAKVSMIACGRYFSALFIMHHFYFVYFIHSFLFYMQSAISLPSLLEPESNHTEKDMQKHYRFELVSITASEVLFIVLLQH